MKKKLISAVVLIAMLFSCMNLQVFALSQPANTPIQANNQEITPYWDNTNNVILGLSFSGTTANCRTSVTAYTGTTSITVDMDLQRINSNGTYESVKTWTVESSGRTLNTTKSASVTRGYEYCLAVNVCVVRNGEAEYIYLEEYKTLN